MNDLWSTSDKSQFISAGWNTGLLKYVYRTWFWWSYENLVVNIEFPSALEPGKDEICVVILYIREHKPSWKMFPCNAKISRYWICKHYATARDSIHHQEYPSLSCRDRSLMIDNMCYEYRLVPRLDNDMLNCGFDNAYLSYVNQNLARHGISIMFIQNCTDLNIYGNKLQGIMSFHNHGYHRTPTKVKIFQLKTSGTNFSVCGPQTQRCDDGSCRVQSIICMFDFECAPHLCACMIGNQLHYNKHYCRHQCPPGICTCPSLTFQCSTGGCIPYTHVCDDDYNCADASDEFCVAESFRGYYFRKKPVNLRFVSTKDTLRCLGFICSTGLCIDVQLVNDLMPDCADAKDESHSLSIKYESLHFHCKAGQEIPCVPGHSKCFEMNVLCLYDRDHLGHIAYCRDGAHLQDCIYINCINTFKCPQSYCIPLRNVCDGINDCYGREDEINCNNNICPGYLKCRRFEFCIHPTGICDGYSHCPYGDDEEICDILGCPMGCTCLGRGIVCRDKRWSYIPAIPFKDITYLSWGSNHAYFPTFANLSSLSRLVILDLSKSVIIKICPAFQEQYTFYETLQALYLQHNDINHLSPNCFAQLLPLLVINLQGNPLVNIADDAFRGISLNVLILWNTQLSSFSGQWVQSFYNLKVLDTRGVKFSHLSQTAVNSLNELQTVYTDDTKFCCILQNIQHCHGYKGNNRICFRLLSHSLLSAILIFFVITLQIFILISMWYVAKLFAISKPVQFLLHNAILINRSLCLLYVVSIVTIDGVYANHYILWYGSLVNRFVCQGLSIILSSGLVMSNIATSLLDHIAHMAVTRMLFNEKDKLSTVKLLLFSSHVFVITGFGVITSLVDSKMNHQISANHLCSAPLGLSLDNYTWTITGPVFLSTVILFSLTNSIYTYSAIFKSTFSSGKRLQSLASIQINTHHKRLFELTKTLSLSTAFRSLECLPISCIIFLNVHGTDVSYETELVSVMNVVMIGCIGSSLPSIWFPMFSQRRKRRAIPWSES